MDTRSGKASDKRTVGNRSVAVVCLKSTTNPDPSIILILIPDQIQRARLNLAGHAPVDQRFFATVGYPDFLRRNLGQRRRQFVPVGMVGQDQRQLHAALNRALADAHPAARHRGNRIGETPRPAVVECRWRGNDDVPAHLILACDQRGAQLAKIDAPFVVEVAEPLHGAVDIDWLRVPHRAKLGDNALRLAKRVGADEHAAFGFGHKCREQFCHLVARFGMAKNGQPERRFGDEDVTRHDFKRGAGRIGATFVITRNDDAFARIFKQDLCRSKDVAGRRKCCPDIADHYGLTVANRMSTGLFAVAHSHNRQSFGCRPHVAMSAARMVGMAVCHQRAGRWPRRVHPRVGSRDINTVRMWFDPCAKSCHQPYMSMMPNDSHLPPAITDWFAAKGWEPRRHQLEMLAAARGGRHVLLVAPTGSGKTLAGFLPTLVDLIETPLDGLHTLYISPLKALAVDVRRNLLMPIDEMGLPIRVEARTGDTPSDRKKRQRERPPHILLTTPESLSILLSYPDSLTLFAGLKTVVIDEVHAFATDKRGDLLSLCLSRLQSIAPQYRRVALSATVADPEAYCAWLAPNGDIDAVTIVQGDPGAEPDITTLLPEGRVPWAGHSGRYAAPQVMAQIEAHNTTLIFCNTRALAELIFQDLWKVNEGKLPIGIHHGSLDIEMRRKVEAAMADNKLRALVATASLDLGVDWGNVDCVVQMGAPKGSSRLLQRIGRANHRLDEPSKAVLVPGNRFEYLEVRAAMDAVTEGELDPDNFRSGSLDVLAQHLMACACAAPFDEARMLAEVQSALAYSALDAATFSRVLDFISTGGYSLRAYDKFRRLTKQGDVWRVSHPKFVTQHRMNAGIIVEAAMLTVRFKNGRKMGRVEEGFAASLTPGDTFFFSGMSLEVERIDTEDVIVRATSRPARIPSYGGARLALSTNLADRVRRFLCDDTAWHRFPSDVREWLEMQQRRSILPQPGQMLVETFPQHGRHYMVAYPFEGWNAHQSLGMLLTKRMEKMGLKPIGFVANDYALATFSLDPITDPRALFSADILEDEFVEWVESSHLLKRAFREVAVIGGLVERQHPGTRKSGKQVTFSTDLIYDVLRRYEPDHLLLKAAWADARARMTDVGRLARLLDRAADSLVHIDVPRITPLAVPVIVMIGREHVPQGTVDDELLIEAEGLAAEAMRVD